MSVQAAPLAGRCLCGDVQFRVAGTPGDVGACHCRQCQRWSGPFWSAVNVAQADLVLENGSESLAWYPSSEHAERGFCVICGASLFWRQLSPDAERVAVSVGALDQPTGLKTGYHIFTAEAGDTYVVPDDAPHHEAFPG